MRRPTRTYGAKRASVSSAAAAIFGSSSSNAAAPDPVTGRDTLTDITEAVNNIKLEEGEEVAVEEEGEGEAEDRVAPEALPTHPSFLADLAKVYESDFGEPLEVRQFREMFHSRDYRWSKIAEASYAEVYRITEKPDCRRHSDRKEITKTSIVKIMRLQSPTDPESVGCETAVMVSSVISELRIMNALTEITGFVKIKSAVLINGPPGPFYVKPWDKFNHNVEGGSRFTDPRSYTENSIFLGIELGDAGTVLEEHRIEDMAQVWDIFLGTVMALAKGEMACNFEHRDLHENNICISRICSPCEHFDPDSNLRCGFSGLEVTLIDYGLSRATLQNGETMFYDLEDDLEVFQGSDGHPQFNAYRKMRTHLFTNTRTMEKKSWHDDSSRDHSNGHTWDEYKPYTNVIWLHFLLGYLKKNLHLTPGSEFGTLKDFNAETKDLSKRMDTRTKAENGAFFSATEVLEYCIGMGWINYEQAEVSGVFDDSDDNDGPSTSEESPKKSVKGKEKEVDHSEMKPTASKKGESSHFKESDYPPSITSADSLKKPSKQVKGIDQSVHTSDTNSKVANHTYFTDSDEGLAIGGSEDSKMLPRGKGKHPEKHKSKSTREKQATHTYFEESKDSISPPSSRKGHKKLLTRKEKEAELKKKEKLEGFVVGPM